VSSVDQEKHKYFAFISYSHQDTRVALDLSRYLETFPVPAHLDRDGPPLPKRMFPIFRDRAEFSASSNLGAAIEQALAESGALIVLCSPAAAQSQWVNEEIRTFRRVNNPQRIVTVLLEGDVPEAFPPALTENGAEPLAVDFRAHVDNIRDGRLRLVASLLGVDFDALKKRERIRVRNARILQGSLLSIFITVVLVGLWQIVNLERQQENAARDALLYNRTVDSMSIYELPLTALFVVSDPEGFLWVGGESRTPGSMYITTPPRAVIMRINTDGKVLSQFKSASPENYPQAYARGADGGLWFADKVPEGISNISRISENGKLTKYPLSRGASPNGIARGSDGAMWFTDAPKKIGRISSSGAIREFTLPAGIENPGSIAAGPDGAMWFTANDKIGRITMDGGARAFSTRIGSGPDIIAAGADNAMWFGEFSSNKIGRISMTGKVVEFPLPSHGIENNNIRGIVAGPDGALWFSESNVNKIARIAGDGRINEFPTSPDPHSAYSPYDVTVGPDGSLWFATEGGVGRIAGPGVTDYQIPTANSDPRAIARGGDGAIWFTEYQGDKIGRIGDSGKLTEVSIPTSESEPSSITGGRDGETWFTENYGNKIGRIAGGRLTEFSLPGPRSLPNGIAAGPDGALWFTEYGRDKVGRISESGQITEFNLPGSRGAPAAITKGPDGAMWFTQDYSNEIGRITMDGHISWHAVPLFRYRGKPAAAIPSSIAAGPDGALWFTEHFIAMVGRMTTAGRAVQYDVPITLPECDGMTLGLDGDLWFVCANAGKIFRITSGGQVLSVSLPRQDERGLVGAAAPNAIASAPNGDMWFSDGSNVVGRFAPP